MHGIFCNTLFKYYKVIHIRLLLAISSSSYQLHDNTHFKNVFHSLKFHLGVSEWDYPANPGRFVLLTLNSHTIGSNSNTIKILSANEYAILSIFTTTTFAFLELDGYWTLIDHVYMCQIYMHSFITQRSYRFVHNATLLNLWK